MIQINSPVTDKDFAEYYDLRWRILRAPWNQPRGSERDEWEDNAIHICARDDNGHLVGAGRMHTNSSGETWIRYMATEANCRGQGVGSAICQALEKAANQSGKSIIKLNAREHAVPFYIKQGFVVIGEGPTMYNEIHHKTMQKILG